MVYGHTLAGKRNSARFFVMLREKRRDAFQNDNIRAVCKDEDITDHFPFDTKCGKRAKIIPMRKGAGARGQRTAQQILLPGQKKQLRTGSIRSWAAVL